MLAVARLCGQMRRTVAMVAVLALSISACGTTESADQPDFNDQQQQVVEVVDSLAQAGRRGDADRICTDILAKRLVPLPPPVAETLRAASDATIEATSTASAVATLHQRDAASAGSMPDRDRGRMPEERPVELDRSAPGPRR